ncbi:MAG: CAP domain-containing protein [Bdellovibrionales bacterium]|nr:CAP domain-containing protein [Bdellovibrionales bacterium]
MIYLSFAQYFLWCSLFLIPLSQAEESHKSKEITAPGTGLSRPSAPAKEEPSDYEEEEVPNPLKVKLSLEDRDMFRQVNRYRKSKGLKKIAPANSLMAGACAHSERMAKSNIFAHADNQTWARYEAGYQPRISGNSNAYRTENIAAGNGDVTATLNQWKTSAGHNTNLLDPKVQYMGVCRSSRLGSTYTHYWTQVFSGGPEK